MLKKNAFVLLVLVVLSYVAGITTRNMIIGFICLFMLFVAFSFGLLVFVVDLIWRLIPGSFKKTFGVTRGRFKAAFFFCVFLFYLIGGFIEEVFLPPVSVPVSLLFNITTLVFAVFCGWCILRHAGKAILPGSILFIFIVVILGVVGSITIKSGSIEGDNSIDKSRSLQTLPYVSWVPAGESIDKIGVTQYDPNLAFEGINLYPSKQLQEAYLIDMQGDVLHKWAKSVEGDRGWRHVEMCKNKDLLVVTVDGTLMRLDWDSNVQWKERIGAHHDVRVDEAGDIYVLTRGKDVVFWYGMPLPIYNDYIVILSSDGRTKGTVSGFDLVEKQVPSGRVAEVYKGLLKVYKPATIVKILRLEEDIFGCFDILHGNNIEILNRNIKGFCSKGDWLISMREIDLIGVVDAGKKKLIWSWGPGELSKQHNPTLMDNGNVLVFNNAPFRGFSSVIELNPLTREIVWEYRSQPPEEFFTDTRGANQELPNGNILVTESKKGRVFEINRQGRVVWEFYNPHIKKEEKQRETIYRMTRLAGSEVYKTAGMW
jgi:hypothetical protein